MSAPAGLSERASLRVVVPGIPVAWARTSRGMGARTGGAYVSFTPERQRNWKHLAQGYMLQARGSAPLYEGPLSVVIDAVWPRPLKVPKKLGTERRPKVSRPDADNLGKQVCDAAIGVLYGDDAIVVDLHVRKWVAAQGEPPGVEIRVEALTPALPGKEAQSE